MIEYIAMFMADGDTDAVVIFGEPGTQSEHELADMLRAGECPKPVIALLAGEFQENYPPGISFGHVAAIINAQGDTVSAKRKMLTAAGARIARGLGDIPVLLREVIGEPR
jgi:succinyl-CoA synthetase alpha subunit